jgi:hypothetical protein
MSTKFWKTFSVFWKYGSEWWKKVFLIIKKVISSPIFQAMVASILILPLTLILRELVVPEKLDIGINPEVVA